MNKDLCPFGPEHQFYWNCRNHLFSDFDARGIRVDAEGLRSLKPEVFALSIAHDLKGSVVLDPFCGCGGSTIALARSGKFVIASDINEQRVAMAKANAEICGVADRIEFSVKPAAVAIAKRDFDSISLDPPWGARANWRAYPENTCQFKHFEVDPLPIIAKCPVGTFVNMQLPKNFDLNQFRLLPSDTIVPTWFKQPNGDKGFCNVAFTVMGLT